MRLTVAALALAGFAGAASAATPTPTPRPRLSGGFGRAEATPPPPRGQSLKDVVHAAEESRKARETPRPGSSVSITNRSLVTDPNRGKMTSARTTPRPHAAPETSAAKETPAPAAAAKPEAAGGPTPVPAAEDAASAEEERWHTIARNARQRVADGRENVARLEAEARKLENDFYSWDDGQYRDNVIKPSWDKKREELETARRELADAERDLADLPEKARKAGALPGWIRE